MRAGCAALVIASLLASRPAAAAPRTYRDDITKFAITPPFSAAQIPCIYIPEGELTPGCEKTKGASFGSSAGERAIVAGTILEGTWTSAFAVTTKYENDVGE